MGYKTKTKFNSHKNKRRIKMKATKEQFEAYIRVQKSGNYNMFSPDAILSTGLDKETYFDIIEHYSEYEEKYEGGK
tara:strand:- start:202 stop:429 length:228 start_codon:yes stop_codon:yes gene_type:complete